MTTIKRHRSTAFLALALTVAFVLGFFESRHLDAGDHVNESAPQSGLHSSADIDSHHSTLGLVGRAEPDASGPVQITSSPRGAKVMGRMLIENTEFACKHRGIRLIAVSEPRAAVVQAAPGSMPDLVGSVADRDYSIIAGSFITGSFIVGEVAVDGAVAFSEIPMGKYAVDAYCDEYPLVRGPTIIDVKNIEAKSIEGKTIETRALGNEPYEWVFNAGLRLEVSVVDASGSPVPNASLYLGQDPQSGALGSHATRGKSAESTSYRAAFADHTGRHTFTGLDAGQYRLMLNTLQSLEHEGYELVKEIRLSDKQDLYAVQLTVPTSGRIEIHIRSSDGLPVDGLVFYARSDQDGAIRKSIAQRDGRHLIAAVPRGKHRLSYARLSTPAIALPIPGKELVAVTGSQPTIVDIQLDAATGFIDGRVVDELGRPAVGVAVQAIPLSPDNVDRTDLSAQGLPDPSALQYIHSNRSTTDANGYFRIEKLDARRSYQLEARSGSAGILRSETVFAGRFVEMAFPQSASIGGRVTQRDGTAVNNFVVYVSSRTTGLGASQSFSSQDGEFRLDSVVPGSIRLSAVGVDTELVGTQTVELYPGQQLTGVTITIADLQ